ncbi:hypothetical protein [Methanimicrococcus hongohii]|uniref:hypothetical protein n=1 Tax=Methanimicrococcus hongohii TaxID=3028295 RepID=UPI00292F3C96|nr:hypothetical protein [Methanimicrococcus sp. Hf6]
MLSCNCILLLPVPAKTANLQLSFNIAVAGAVCVAAAEAVSVSACICYFYLNPFAFANVPLLPAGFCFRRYLPLQLLLLPAVTVTAATYRFLLRQQLPPPRELHRLFKSFENLQFGFLIKKL